MKYDYVVDASWDGNEGQVCFRGWIAVRMFSTIQGAIDAALKKGLRSPHINVKPGTYAENCTFSSGVHLKGGSNA